MLIRFLPGAQEEWPDIASGPESIWDVSRTKLSAGGQSGKALGEQVVKEHQQKPLSVAKLEEKMIMEEEQRAQELKRKKAEERYGGRLGGGEEEERCGGGLGGEGRREVWREAGRGRKK